MCLPAYWGLYPRDLQMPDPKKRQRVRILTVVISNTVRSSISCQSGLKMRGKELSKNVRFGAVPPPQQHPHKAKYVAFLVIFQV